jgi:8-oxo-dGTP pyrophosphatase MutT (NUDIX family)
MSKSGAATTLAAGGVVWKRSASELQIAVVHRPKYDDWTLPKGKLESGERSLLAAVREIAEETGAIVQVGRRLASVHYALESGPKLVSYWSMRYLSGEHVPDGEVDLVRWVSPAQAFALLSYPGDRTVLADFTGSPLATSTILLIRHAKAGKRANYRGDDRLRPLEKIGRRQSRDSVDFLNAFGPSQVLSADRVRCEQTVAPLATKLGLAVLSRPSLRALPRHRGRRAAGSAGARCRHSHLQPGRRDTRLAHGSEGTGLRNPGT